MRNFDNMLRQHSSIHEDIDYLISVIEKGSKDINAMEAAIRISRLAGKLNIHMLEEDKFLYPELINSSDSDIRTMANQYMSEMGYLAEEYSRFKMEYNTANKILSKPDTFILEAKKIINALLKRINKEDNELYAFIQNKLANHQTI